MKKTYITPAIEQEEVVVESGIAVSTFIEIYDNGNLEDWEEGHTNWW